jgi:hypothetical protein
MAMGCSGFDLDKNISDCKKINDSFQANNNAVLIMMMGNQGSMANCQGINDKLGAANSATQVIPGDCTNPANASDPVCLGLHAGAMNSAGAGTDGSYSNSVGAYHSGGAAISGLAGSMDNMSLPSDLASANAKANDKSAGLAMAPNTGSGSSGGFGNGSGPSGSSAKKKGGAAADPRDTKMYGGLITGAQGSGSSGSTYSGGSRPVMGAQYANQSNPKAGPDLSKFAPNMKYQGGRNLAGVTGPDGITGPNSNLFSKVNNQFNLQTMQDRMFAPNQ